MPLATIEMPTRSPLERSGRPAAGQTARRAGYPARAGSRLLIERAKVKPGERILDVGCGCGATSAALAREVGPSGLCWASTSPRRC